MPTWDTWVSIDGEEYTQEEATALQVDGLVECCPHEECPHQYHKLEGYVDADLLVTLERLGMGPR